MSQITSLATYPSGVEVSPLFILQTPDEYGLKLISIDSVTGDDSHKDLSFSIPVQLQPTALMMVRFLKQDLNENIRVSRVLMHLGLQLIQIRIRRTRLINRNMINKIFAVLQMFKNINEAPSG